MSLPKKRVSKSKRGMRRSHHAAKHPASSTSKCTRCGAAHLPHRVCATCGYYKNKDVLRLGS